jgi:DNA transformation protein
MRGLGPSSRAQLAALGIHTLDELRQHEPVALYARLKQQWPAANMNLLYALIGAQEDLDWRQVARERRSELLLRLDDLGLAPR